MRSFNSSSSPVAGNASACSWLSKRVSSNIRDGSASLSDRAWDDAAMASVPVVGLETLMGTKDKGGKHTRKVAARDLKQKRLEKRKKRDAAQGKQSGLV